MLTSEKLIITYSLYKSTWLPIAKRLFFIFAKRSITYANITAAAGKTLKIINCCWDSCLGHACVGQTLGTRIYRATVLSLDLETV